MDEGDEAGLVVGGFDLGGSGIGFGFQIVADGDRISLAPVWQATAKTAVRLRHTVSQRRFLGHPEGLPGSTRRDLTHETALAVTWAAHRNATLSASLARSTRSSTTPGLDFSSNRALISAQIRF